MNDGRADELLLDHAEQVSLYVHLSRFEDSLDDRQATLLQRLARHLYARLSVSEMEEIEAYYGRLGEHV